MEGMDEGLGRFCLMHDKRATWPTKCPKCGVWHRLHRLHRQAPWGRAYGHRSASGTRKWEGAAGRQGGAHHGVLIFVTHQPQPFPCCVSVLCNSTADRHSTARTSLAGIAIVMRLSPPNGAIPMHQASPCTRMVIAARPGHVPSLHVRACRPYGDAHPSCGTPTTSCSPHARPIARAMMFQSRPFSAAAPAGRPSQHCPSALADASGAAELPSPPRLANAPSAISRGLWKRIVSSTVLGALGAVVIAVGGLPYCLVACLVAYQSSQEYFGFVTSKGISQGMMPPPPMLCAFISLTCISFIVWMYATQGAATAMLGVSGLVVLSLQLLMVKTPRFSQLTSSLFGLFYCGAHHVV